MSNNTSDKQEEKEKDVLAEMPDISRRVSEPPTQRARRHSKAQLLRGRMSITNQTQKSLFQSAEDFAGLSKGEIMKVSRRIDNEMIESMRQGQDPSERYSVFFF